MTADNTALFRARAKMLVALQTAKSKKEAASGAQPPSHSPHECNGDSGFEENNRRQTSPNYLGYSSRALDIRRSLTQLRDMVIDRRRSYITAVGHTRCFAASSGSGMSEWERSEMDVETDNAIRNLTHLIRLLKGQVIADDTLRAADEGSHLNQVIRILEAYLKRVTKIVADLRAVCLKKTADVKRISRLSTLVQMYEKKVRATAALKQSVLDDNLRKLSDDEGSCEDHRERTQERPGFEDSEGLRRRGAPVKVESKVEAQSAVKSEWSVDSGGVEDSNTDEELNEFGDAERLQLVEENERLYAKFMHADSDVQRIEKQLTDIHRLQETLAEKVLEQETDIDFVNEAAVHTVENIRAGNEQIREAIQNIASRRVILLFCIIVLTFTLLFLDWYNP